MSYEKIIAENNMLKSKVDSINIKLKIASRKIEDLELDIFNAHEYLDELNYKKVGVSILERLKHDRKIT